jgi:fucose 4-O-acetylase-like acetyltransferase
MNLKKKIHIGLAFLRIYLSFLVVSSHCYKPKASIRERIIIKIIHNKNHVPTFYILSFYLCYNLFKSKNIKKIKIRFQRLLIPYFIWPIIIWSLENILSFFFIKINSISFKKMILQLLTGHVFINIFWFQYNLIFITLLIIIINLLLKENLVYYALINLKIFAIFFTYSYYNYNFFSKYKSYIKYTFGRFFEIIPYCITGYILASLNLVYILSKKRIISINIFLPILFLLYKYKIFFNIKGFYYQGLELYVSSISIFFLFSIMPNERLENKYIIRFIEILSMHTAGVYYLHCPISYYLYFFMDKNNNLIEVIIIYFISYFICLFGKLIFRETKLINLFQ